jgi:RecA/RadA recombinase
MNLSQVLSEIKSSKDRNPCLTTGSTDLDRLLVTNALEPPSKKFKSEYAESLNRLKRGSLVELCGPPGSGKTLTSLRLAKDALVRGHQVIWIRACDKVVPAQLLAELVRAELDEPDTRRVMKSFLMASCESLIRLMAVLREMLSETEVEAHASSSLSRLALVVVDDLTFLVESSYSPGARNLEILERRRTAVNEVARYLCALAKRKNCAVIAVSKAVPRRGMLGIANLVSCLGYGSLEKWFTSRVMLYRGDQGERLARKFSTGETVIVAYSPNATKQVLFPKEQPLEQEGPDTDDQSSTTREFERKTLSASRDILARNALSDLSHDIIDRRETSNLAEESVNVISKREDSISVEINEHVIGKQEISSSANSEILSLIDEGELSSSTDEVDSHIDQDNSEARMNHEKLILLADVTAGEIQDSQALYDELSEGEFES